MSTEQINAQLEKLSLGKLESFPGCYPDVNPVDVYRSHITTMFHEVTGVEKSIIYNALQWTQSLDKGDMVLAVPALRIKGKKPAELSEEWLPKVSLQLLIALLCMLQQSTCATVDLTDALVLPVPRVSPHREARFFPERLFLPVLV